MRHAKYIWLHLWSHLQQISLHANEGERLEVEREKTTKSDDDNETKKGQWRNRKGNNSTRHGRGRGSEGEILVWEGGWGRWGKRKESNKTLSQDETNKDRRDKFLFTSPHHYKHAESEYEMDIYVCCVLFQLIHFASMRRPHACSDEVMAKTIWPTTKQWQGNCCRMFLCDSLDILSVGHVFLFCSACH